MSHDSDVTRSASSVAATRVAVCLCTYRRPEVARALLARLNDEAQTALDDGAAAPVAVSLVDDDPAASARTVVDEANHPALDLRYLHSGLGNVAAARNRALDDAVNRGDLLVMLDDDCVPEPGWMRELVAVQRETGADAVAGVCDTAYPPGTPRWLREQPFLDPPHRGLDRQPTDVGYLKNCLFTTEFVERHRLRFDVDYGVGGGEDAVFLDEARRRGVRMVFAANALVYENLPSHRTRLAYQLRRRFWYGNTEVLTSLAASSSTRSRMAAATVKLIVVAVVRPFANVARRRPPHLLFNASEVLRAAGRVLGLAGVRLDHR